MALSISFDKLAEENTIPDLGPYRLDIVLGRGGMGQVYRAWDARLERWVAIKRLLDTSNASARRQLRREARTAARIRHPAILQIFDIIEKDDADWIVMEMVDGPNLAALLKKGPLDFGLALDYGRQIADGLAAAHAKEIVHRDLKTENVMVLSSGHIKILDFGIAQTLGSGSSDGTPSNTARAVDSTQANLLVGTPRAMSPEQVLGYQTTSRSDLFSLGVLLYELLTTISPFRGRTVLETLSKVVTQQQTPLDSLNRHVPRRLAELVNRLLEKDPAHRPRGAFVVADELAEILAMKRLHRTLLREIDFLNGFDCEVSVPSTATPGEGLSRTLLAS